jgi:methylated-DNA-[protein]-cysteine S-methyltransferase
MSSLVRVPTPIGDLLVTGDDVGVTGVCFADSGASHASRAGAERRPSAPVLAAAEQLAAYFEGALREFDLRLSLSGSPFFSRVWDAVRAVPFGETRTYGQVAAQLGAPAATRAVGAANGRNPLPIIVPCHRLIGANGNLTGYGGGLERKRWLLDHEARIAGSA